MNKVTRAIRIDWDGRRVPAALRKAPPGRYWVVAEPARGNGLSAEEESGIVRALDQLDAGDGRSLSAVISAIRQEARRR